MLRSIENCLIATLAVAPVALNTADTIAQQYPLRPVRLIVPFLPDVTDWQGLLAPAQTPQSLVERIHRDATRALQERDVKERLANAGLQVVTNTPAEFMEFIRSESRKWGDVIQKSRFARE